jgi:hypothetical protein
MKDLNRMLLLYSTSIYNHCRYVATDMVVLYRALALFTVKLSSLVRFGNPRENNVENKCAPSTSGGTCRRRYNADHLKTPGQRGSVSLFTKQSTELLPQFSHSLSFLSRPVDNDRDRQSILLYSLYVGQHFVHRFAKCIA